jgi:hypothetical protein
MLYLFSLEFYSTIKKNEILSFASKWMELENIIAKILCTPSYTDFRSIANAVMLLDLGHTLGGEHIREEWRSVGNTKLESGGDPIAEYKP